MIYNFRPVFPIKIPVKKYLFTGEAGMATAEFAIALPAVMIVLAITLGGLAAGAGKIECCSQARNAARAVAIGENISNSNSVDVNISKTGKWVKAEGKKQIPGLGWTGITVSCAISMINEPVIDNV